MKTPYCRHLLTAAIAAALLPALSFAAAVPDADPAPAAETETDAQQGDAAKLETVTVTAQRREETLQKTPITITALTDTDIERKQLRAIDDLKFEVPNIVIEPNTGTTTTAPVA